MLTWWRWRTGVGTFWFKPNDYFWVPGDRAINLKTSPHVIAFLHLDPHLQKIPPSSKPLLIPNWVSFAQTCERIGVFHIQTTKSSKFLQSLSLTVDYYSSGKPSVIAPGKNFLSASKLGVLRGAEWILVIWLILFLSVLVKGCSPLSSKIHRKHRDAVKEWNSCIN